MPDMPEGWQRPKQLLTQNAELKDIGAYNWTLPAFVVKLTDGSHINTCPSAGVCASICYARQGKFNFPSVKQAHVEKLEWVLYDPEGWESSMIEEASKPKYKGKHIRIHDSGDFFSDEYLMAWLRIATACPNSIFYCYTKEVERFRRIVENRDGEFEGLRPVNFKYLFSFGGKQDRSIVEGVDRAADIFPSFEAMEKAGYTTQHVSDLQAIYNENPRVGLPYNNIPHLKKVIRGRTFKQMQEEQTVRLETRGLPEEERAERLKGLTVIYKCKCGNSYSKAPAEGCTNWGHAISRSADNTQRMMKDAGEKVPRGDRVPAKPLDLLKTEDPLG